VVDFIPFGLFFIMQHRSVAIQQPDSDAVEIGTLTWAAITFLTTLDPEYMAKLAAIRDLLHSCRDGAPIRRVDRRSKVE
jgi:hypothetical protein